MALGLGIGASGVMLTAFGDAFGDAFLQLTCPELHRSVKPGDAEAVS